MYDGAAGRATPPHAMSATIRGARSIAPATTWFLRSTAALMNRPYPTCLMLARFGSLSDRDAFAASS
jgi:hypothetical protein